MLRNVYVRRLLKPWFIYNPFLLFKALMFDLGIAPHRLTQIRTCFGAHIYCDTSKAIGRAIYKNGVYELATSELIWRLLADSPGALFIDVGANVGYYSLLARKRLGDDGIVMSFEPMPDIHEILIRNLRGMNVETYRYAVSSGAGHATLSIPKGSEANDGTATLQDCKEVSDSFRVETVALDDVVDNEIAVLKIDVEGHEFSALSGAKALLARGKIRNVVFEDHDIDRSDVVTLLTSLGYSIFSIGWNLSGLMLRPLGEPNDGYVKDAPNYIATLDLAKLAGAAGKGGWTILRSNWE